MCGRLVMPRGWGRSRIKVQSYRAMLRSARPWETDHRNDGATVSTPGTVATGESPRCGLPVFPTVPGANSAVAALGIFVIRAIYIRESMQSTVRPVQMLPRNRHFDQF